MNELFSAVKNNTSCSQIESSFFHANIEGEKFYSVLVSTVIGLQVLLIRQRTHVDLFHESFR